MGDGPSTGTINVTAIPAAVGTAVVNNGGTPNDPTDDTIDFTPALDYNGPVTITYEIEDDGPSTADGDTSSATVTFDVTPVDDTPTATNDTPADVAEDSGTTNIAVLGNDSFGGDGPSTGTINVTAIPAAVGTAVVNNGGTPNDPTDDTIDFTPALDYNGPVTITYEIEDADGDTSSATVTFDVTPVDDTPTATNDTPADVAEDSGTTNIAVLGNDSFGGDGPSTGTINVTAIPAAVGTAVVNNGGTPNDPTDDTIDFTPALDYNGPVTITYEIEDADGDTSSATVTFDVTPVDDTPTATNDTPADVAEDSGTTNIAVLGNDSFGGDGPSTGTINVTAIPAAVGTAVVNNGGTPNDPTDDTIDFTPALDYNGPVTITYEIEDADGDTSSATVTFDVTPVDDTPTAVNDTPADVAEDSGTTNIAVLGNDSFGGDGPSTGTINVTAIPAAVGTAVVNNGGTPNDPTDDTIDFTPALDYNGPVTITYEIEDADGDTSSATVTFDVTPVDDTPTATNDTPADVAEDSGTTNIAVLGNDSFGGDGPSTGTINVTAIPAAVGNAVVNNGGTPNDPTDDTIDFTPALDYNGPVTITYEIEDADGDTSSATVTFDVTPVDDTPTATNDTPADVAEDSGTTNIAVLGNDSFGGDGPSTGTINVTAIPAAVGTAVVNNGGTPNDPTDDTIDFTPALDYNGPVTITYEIEDADGDTSSATVTFDVTPVDDTPTATNDTPADVAEDSGTTNIAVLGNDSFGGDGPSTGTINVTAIPAAVGTAVVNNGGTPNDPTDDTIDFTPALDYNGPVTITYEIEDADGDTSSATVTFDVTPVDDTPTATNDTPADVAEDSGTTNIAVLGNDSFGGDGPSTGTINVTAIPAAVGTAVVNNGGTPNDPTDDTIDFTPALDYNGPVTITYEIEDADGDTSSATVTFDVTPVDDTPTAVNDTPADVAEDSGTTNIAVLGNDSFGGDGPSTGTINVTAIPAAVGTAVVNNGGTPNDPTDDTIDFTPALDYNGPVTITYEIEDADGDTSSATVTFDVTPVDDTPTAVNDTPADVAEDSGTTNIAVLGNDSFGGDGPSTGTINVTAIPAAVGTAVVNNGGTPNDPTDDTIDFTPALDYNGPVTITYEIEDADGDTSSATVTFDVTPVDDTPTAVNDTPADVAEDSGTTNIAVLGNDSFGGDGPSTGTINVTAIPAAVGTAVVNNGGTPNDPTDDTIDFTPALDYNGPVTITYEIEDADGDTSSATVTFDVTPVDDTPTATNDTPADVAEDSGTTNIAVLGNDSFGGDGPSTGTINVTAIPAAVGTAVVNNGGTPNDPTDDTIDFTPALDYNGPVTITYEIEDADGDTSSATVTFDVTPVDDTPTATNDTPADVAEDSGTTNIAVLGNDSFGGDGPSTGTINVTAIPAAVGTAVVNNGGTPNDPTDDTIDFTPALDYNGPVTITYEIEDADGDTSSATVTFDVTPVDDTPTATDDNLTVDEDSTAGVANQIDVSTNDNIGGDGGDGDDFAIATGPTNGTVVEVSDGVFEYVPNVGFSGTDSFTYTITDVDGSTATATVNVTVNDTGDPLAVNDTTTTIEDTPVTTGNVLTNDTVIDDATITAFDAISANGGTVVNNGDGTFTYTPPVGFVGDDTFTYTLCDDDTPASCSTATVTVTVTDEGDPVAVDDTVTTIEDTPVTTGNVLDNDTVVDDATITAFDATSTNGGTVVNNGDGTFTYTPPPGFVGDDTFTYTLCDDDTPASCSTATVTVTVTDEGDPVAVDDTVTTIEDTPVTTGNVLDNDTVVDDAMITAFDATSTNGGTVVNNGDGTFTYTPPPGFLGDDTFTYTLCDDDTPPSCSTATVTVTVIEAPAPLLVLVKTAEVDGAQVGDEITYTFTVTNTGNTVIDNITVDDPLTGSVNLAINPSTLAPGEEGTASATYVLTQADINLGEVMNSATVIGQDPIGNDVMDISDSGDELVDEDGDGDPTNDPTITQIEQLPNLALTKLGIYVDTNNDGLLNTGDEIQYTFTVTNTGNVDITNITLSDPLPGIVINGGPIDLLVGETDESSFTAVYTLTEDDIFAGRVENQATVTGQDPNGEDITDLSDDPLEDINVDLDNDGDFEDITITVLDIRDSEIEIFTGLSPNGDGINDEFRIVGLQNFPRNNLQIFNRWGVKVFDQDGYEQPGVRFFVGISEGRTTISKNRELPVGTYYYVLRFEDSEGITRSRAGYLYINR